MLDTDICSYIIKKRPLSVLEIMQEKAISKSSLVISSITYSELRLGALRSAAKDKHTKLINGFCLRLTNILPWDVKAGDEYAKIQAELLAKGNPIGSNDAMIAGHALSTKAILVTNNIRHFKHITGLTIENWAA